MTNQARRNPAAVARFNHAMVYVRDIERAVAFYSGLLGLEVIEQDPEEYARLRSVGGETTIALHRVSEAENPPEGEGIRLYFETEALDELCKLLKASGVTILQGPELMPWGWRHAYLTDPDGHELSLYTAGEKRFQKTRP